MSCRSLFLHPKLVAWHASWAPKELAMLTLSAMVGALMRPNGRARASPAMLTRGYQGDPYAALGLEEGASAGSIRAAFRMQAKVLHPDISDDPTSAAKFCALCAAVEALQSGGAFAKVSKAANVDVPQGLCDDERVRWLISKNKVLLFMRGTKQKPLCDDSASMVATLSWVAFDTDTHFTAVNVAVDAPLGEAALRAAGMAVLPLCFIDGTLVGSSDEVDVLYESGELMRAFGGEMLVRSMRRDG